MAWEANEDPTTGGQWRGSDHAVPQHWCDVYIFAWLEADSTAPPLGQVIEPRNWQFAALSRNAMYHAFVNDRPSPQKSVGLSSLGQIANGTDETYARGFIGGENLANAIHGLDLENADDVPPLQMAHTKSESETPTADLDVATSSIDAATEP